MIDNIYYAYMCPSKFDYKMFILFSILWFLFKLIDKYKN